MNDSIPRHAERALIPLSISAPTVSDTRPRIPTGPAGCSPPATSCTRPCNLVELIPRLPEK